MVGPRNYSRTTIFALAALANKTCYWPDPPCMTPITVLIKGQPVRNVQIAHIRAARPNGPRYVPGMTDEDRRHWRNLILLCTPHHNMIDKIKPQDYPIEMLQEWKAARETQSSEALNELGGVTEDRLQDIIAGAMQDATKELKGAIAQIARIDPDAAILLRDAARRINPDTADTLYSAARSLSPAMDPGNVEMLWHAANTLKQMNLAGAVSELDGLIPVLNKVVTNLRHAQDSI